MKFKDFLKESTKQETFIVNAKNADEFIELLDDEDVEYEVLTQDRNELIVSVLDSTKRILKLAKRLGVLSESNKTSDVLKSLGKEHLSKDLDKINKATGKKIEAAIAKGGIAAIDKLMKQEMPLLIKQMKQLGLSDRDIELLME